MSTFFKDIIDEFKKVFKGKTFDALLSPLIYVIVNGVFGFVEAVIASLLTALLVVFWRLYKRHALIYAAFGFFAVLFAAGFAYFADQASNYFLPSIIGSSLLFLLTLITLVIKKPLAAWASHLTRGWPTEWFWREDIRPAYMEVTLLWLFFFLFRIVIQSIAYLEDDIVQLFWLNLLLGFPAIVIILTITYIYGIWRLRTLKGPSVDEFIQETPPPYEGQRKGF